MVATSNHQDFISDLFSHNTWANLKLLEACENLNDMQLDSIVPGTFGTIRDTLLHIVGAEVSYVQRVSGRLPGDPPQPGEFPSMATLKEHAVWCGEELKQLTLSASAEDMVRQTRRGQNIEYRLTTLMVQAINHSTEHRSQVATILTQLGFQPPEMSGWAFMEEMGYLTRADAAPEAGE